MAHEMWVVAGEGSELQSSFLLLVFTPRNCGWGVRQRHCWPKGFHKAFLAVFVPYTQTAHFQAQVGILQEQEVCWEVLALPRVFSFCICTGLSDSSDTTLSKTVVVFLFLCTGIAFCISNTE